MTRKEFNKLVEEMMNENKTSKEERRRQTKEMLRKLDEDWNEAMETGELQDLLWNPRGIRR